MCYSILQVRKQRNQQQVTHQRNYNQVAYKDRKDRIIAYKFEDGQLICSTGEIVTESANQHRKRTAKGENLKVNKITKKNWKTATRQHADKIGFCKKVDTSIAEFLDFDNLPQPETIDETPFAFIEEWAKKERGLF